MSENLNTKVITPEFKASYVNAWEPGETPNGDLKYSVSMVFSKDTDLSEMKKAAENAAIKKWGNDKSKWPKKLRKTFRDGDEERPQDSVYQNSIFVNASSKQKPGIVDEDVKPLHDQSEFYSGVIARASINFYAYDRAGNAGVAVGLNNLMKVRDGERLGGAAKAEDDFSDFKNASSGESADDSNHSSSHETVTVSEEDLF